MITRQKVVTYGIPAVAAATIAIAASLAGRSAPLVTPPTDEPPPIAADGTHAVDVVFAIDTTSSMTGLIESAKKTVWSIATRVKQIDPQANVRIGIVAFRDLGDDYVTKDFPLSDDLDAMYLNLTGLRAEGGGDIPEDVDAALYDAVHKMPWRAAAKKMVFVVGDAPPASRGDVPGYLETAREAASQGIVVNAIRAGWASDTQVAFASLASAGRGDFSTIQQDGGVQQVATPYDAKMAELSKTIDETAVIVGEDGVREGYARKMEAGAAAAPAAAADRAAYYAAGSGSAAPRDKADIVGKKGVALDDLPSAALPAKLRNLDKAQLEAELAERAKTRATAQAEIQKLAKERESYLKTHAKDGDTAFDAQVKTLVEKSMK